MKIEFRQRLIPTLSNVMAIVLLSLLAVAGCSDNDIRDQVLKDYSQNIRKVHFCYKTYMTRHGDVGPQDKEQLLSYIKNDPTAVHILKQIGIATEDVDGIFVSERDGEPFILKFGIVDESDEGRDFPIVFEAKGVEGVRLVAFQTPKECSSEEYEKYLNEN